MAVEVGGKIYVIGGATTVEGSKDPFFTFFGPSLVLTTNEVYDPATNKWESRKPMSVARNHAFAAAVNGKIYVIGGRTGHAFILSATNTDVVEEYSPVVRYVECSERADADASQRRRLGHGRPQDLRSGWRGDDERARRRVSSHRGVRAGHAIHGSTLPSDADAAAWRRGRGDRQRFHLVSGMIQSAGALSFLDPHLEVHTGQHDVLELNFFFPTPPTGAKKDEAPPSTGAKNVGAAPSSAAVNNVSATSSSARLKNVSAISTEGANSVGTASSGGKKPYIRYNVNSPEGQVMLAKYAQAIEIMRTLPDYDQHSWTWWWNTHWIKGYPGVPVGSLHEKESGGHRGSPEGVSSRCRGRVERLPGPPLQPFRP